MIEVQKGITKDGYTEVILPESLDIKTTRVVVKGAYNLLSAKKNAGEMAC
jgi:cobalt-zinc-cadmium efflux system membrane fusion protein